MVLSKEHWASLKKSALSGDSNNQFEVGMIYDEGGVDCDGNIIVKPNKKKAAFWYEQSAKKGNSSAQNSMGYCYDNGFGVEQNKKEALYWYKKALNQGYLCAASNIASVYRDLGNQKRAFLWYQRAVEMGDGDALLEVGLRYYMGNGIRRNYNLAIEYYRKAIHADYITEFGCQNAMYSLAIAYLEGKGVKKSLNLAKKWLNRAVSESSHDRSEKMLKEIDMSSNRKTKEMHNGLES